MSIFSTVERTNDSPKARKESSFEFLDRASWPIVNYFRDLIDIWLIPFLGDNEFISKFKSKDDKQHYGALFELLVYRILSYQNNYSIQKHPLTKTGKQPDYKIVNLDNGDSVYFECTLSSDSFDDIATKSKTASIEEIIDSLEYFDFWVSIDVITHSNKSLPKRTLINWIKLTADTIRNQYKSEAYWKAKFKYEEWLIEFTFIAKNETSIKRTLGFTSGGVKMIDTVKPIRNALKDKAPGKYGISNESYVICLSTSDQFVKEECCFEALFGQGDINRISKRYSREGLLLQNGLERNTSITAVLSFLNFDIFTLSSCKIALWNNPFAKSSLNNIKLPFNEYRYKGDENELSREVVMSSIDIFDVLDINKEMYENTLRTHK
ncbi:MAG: hypothetical protein EOO42_09930 [Flavobacteriales bacterium]|nr:MAG: hypothetical protein EOO42_09930 [Flavobacteriales bacterium]